MIEGTRKKAVKTAGAPKTAGAAKTAATNRTPGPARAASTKSSVPKPAAKRMSAGAKTVLDKAAVEKSPMESAPASKPAKKSVPEVGHDVNLGFLSDFVGFHLRLAQDASYRAYAKHRDKDLIKPGRFPALAIIHLNPGISQSALGRAIARDKSTVSPLIKDLQQNGFISRKPSPHDRRSVTLALTKKGERTLEKLHTRAAEHESELDKIVGTSKGRLMSLLDKIIVTMAA
jgi:DNA-binding MarR family transcriptional regulator